MTEDEMVTDSMDMNLSKLREMEDREAWRAAVHGGQTFGHDLATGQQHIHNDTLLF